MDKHLKNRIKSRLGELGISARAASLRVSQNPDMIRGLLRGDVEANPTRETLEKVATALEVSIEWLLGIDETPPDAPVRSPEVRAADVELPVRHGMAQDVPVLGTAAGSVIRQVEGFQFDGDTIEFVRRPPGLSGVKEIYALYITGDSMYPMHPSGELRFVHPRRPVRIGDSVIVQTKHHEDDPGQAYIKLLKGRTPTKLILEQFTPPATIEISTAYVAAVHRVLTTNELFGL